MKGLTWEDRVRIRHEDHPRAEADLGALSRRWRHRHRKRGAAARLLMRLGIVRG